MFYGLMKTNHLLKG